MLKRLGLTLAATLTAAATSLTATTAIPATAAEAAPAAKERPLLIGLGGGNIDPADAEKRFGASLMVHRLYHAKGRKPSSAGTWIKRDIAAGRQVSQLSFKAPLTWEQMADGKGDDFFKEAAAAIRAAVKGTDHRVQVTVNHEPENDFANASAAVQDRKRDAWKAMQNRAARFFADISNVEYGVILMGYHSFPGLWGGNYPRWSLENAVPSTRELDWVGLDVYEDHEAPKTWRPFETKYFAHMQKFAAKRGLEWGLSETGVTERAFAKRPTWFTDLAASVEKYDGSFVIYFNTDLNSIATWSMKPGDHRERAFGAALRARRTI
jgi:hypothetical protein